MTAQYPRCVDCRWARISFWHWVFGDGQRFARCANPKTTGGLPETEERYHLGRLPKVGAAQTESCKLLRSSCGFPFGSPERSCGPEARHFEPKRAA